MEKEASIGKNGSIVECACATKSLYFEIASLNKF